MKTSTTPAAQALVQEWRKAALSFRGSRNEIYGDCLDDCADELEVALALTSQAGDATQPEPAPDTERAGLADKLTGHAAVLQDMLTDDYPAQDEGSAPRFTMERDALTAAIAMLTSASSAGVVDDLYWQLIYAVESKFPNETRHETALRYIRQSENQDHGPVQEAALRRYGESEK